MKTKLFLSNVAIGLVFIALGYFLNIDYFSSVFAGIGVSFLAIAAGIVVVHFYLDRASRQAATISIFSLTHNSLVDFHESFLEIMWATFSSEYFREICSLYNDRQGELNVIKPEDRKKIFLKIEENKEKLLTKAESLEETLREMTNLIGWDLDPHLLALTLSARNHLRSYLSYDWEDDHEEHDQDFIVQNALEIDDYIELILQKLVTLCDLNLKNQS